MLEALNSITGNTPGGRNGALPEIFKCWRRPHGVSFETLQSSVVRANCHSGVERCPRIHPKDVTCHLVTTGDLSVGKVFGKTIQKGLQTVAKDVLLDTRCGFRSGW